MKSTPTFSESAACISRASSSITATPLAPSFAAITGVFQFLSSGSLSAHGRLSQWAQSITLVVLSGCVEAMMFVLFSAVPS